MLNKLINCLVDEFRSVNSGATFNLGEDKFSLLNRMSCAKQAGLNYEYLSALSGGAEGSSRVNCAYSNYYGHSSGIYYWPA